MTDRHDVILCREILIHNPFQYKKSSIQRGHVWNDIAERLVAVDKVRFKSDLDRRSVCDRYNLLANKLRRKLKDERKASGIETDMSEVEVALEDLIEREDESDKQHKENQDQNLMRKEDRQQAEDIRTKSLERLGETQKRKGQDSNLQTKAKKKRATGGDAVVFLRERTEAMVAARKEEVNMKVKQQEAEGWVLEKSVFLPLRASVWSKNKVGRLVPPRAPPLDPPLCQNNSPEIVKIIHLKLCLMYLRLSASCSSYVDFSSCIDLENFAMLTVQIIYVVTC